MIMTSRMTTLTTWRAHEGQMATRTTLWGPKFANNGFFTLDKASTLEIIGSLRMRFYDVYWTTDDLSAEEIVKWKEHEVKTVRNLIGVLPKPFHDLPVDRPSALRENRSGAQLRRFMERGPLQGLQANLHAYRAGSASKPLRQ
jgi:hypothetical protein